MPVNVGVMVPGQPRGGSRWWLLVPTKPVPAEPPTAERAPPAVPPAAWAMEPVRRAELARGDATAPPSAIGVIQVQEHALRHLAWHGHRRIALVGPSPAVYRRGTSYADRFLTGFTEASAALGLQTMAHPCEPGT